MCGGKTARARGAGKYIGCREDTTWNVSKGASGVWGNSSGRQARRQANSTRALAGCLVWARTSSRVLVDSSCAARQIEMAMLLRRCCWPHRVIVRGPAPCAVGTKRSFGNGRRRSSTRSCPLDRIASTRCRGCEQGRLTIGAAPPSGDAEAVTRQARLAVERSRPMSRWRRTARRSARRRRYVVRAFWRVRAHTVRDTERVPDGLSARADEIASRSLTVSSSLSPSCGRAHGFPPPARHHTAC